MNHDGVKMLKQKIQTAWAQNQSMLCLGIDPCDKLLAEKYQDSKQGYIEFAKYLVEQTYDLVCGYKFQLAFFNTPNKQQQLIEAIKYIRKPAQTFWLLLMVNGPTLKTPLGNMLTKGLRFLMQTL